MNKTLLSTCWLFLPSVLLLAGCTPEIAKEKWIGHYSYPGSDIQFPLYLDIEIQGIEVKGLAFDGNMEKADISGSVEKGYYSLLLHPVKHGKSTKQDVHYRGQRTGSAIAGNWEHVVGATGSWVSNLTNNGPKDALKPYKVPCKTASSSMGCGNGAL